MSLAELNAALDEIAAARLTDEEREWLENRICKELGGPKGGPKFVMERFVGSMQRGSWKWVLGYYFKTWMDQNPDQAVAWLAKHVDQMKDLSFGFLDQSFHPLLESDPETAGRLLAAIPPERRRESLRSLNNRDMSPAQQIGWAEVTRRHLPDKDRLVVIAWPIMNWSDGDGWPMTMPWVSAYLERIKASPPERESCIIAAAQEQAGVDDDTPGQLLEFSPWLADFRRWVAGLEPDLVDKATGVALAKDGIISQEVVNLAVGYHAKSRNDLLLLPLLERDHDGKEEVPLARKLAGHLSDDKLRQKYLEKFKETNP